MCPYIMIQKKTEDCTGTGIKGFYSSFSGKSLTNNSSQFSNYNVSSSETI